MRPGKENVSCFAMAKICIFSGFGEAPYNEHTWFFATRLTLFEPYDEDLLR